MFGKNNFNFAFIGAGSTTFTLGLVSDILHEPDIIHGGELRLVDTDPDALEDAYKAVCVMIKQSGRSFVVSKHIDYREVLPGIDFVLFTFVTGKYPSWKTDIDICTKHGVLQSVGDTIGPGGIIRTIRNAPVVYEITREMEKVCPDAWAINYSNPEGALCLAIEKYSKIRTFGLCHGLPNLMKRMADQVFKVEPERIRFRGGGINHMTWLTELTVDGKDAYPTLREKLIAAGWDKYQPISLQLYDWFGLYPGPQDRHIQEFFSNYMRDRVLEEQDYAWKNNDFVAVQRWRDEALENLDRLIKGEIGYAEYGTSGETATVFMRALITNETGLEMASVMNRGYISNISDGIIVEVPVFIDAFGLHPQTIGSLPEGAAAKCEAIGREYNLAVEAAISCDRNLALQAMMLDPLVAHCDYPERLLDDLLRAYLPLLPEAWKAQVSS